MSIQTDENDTSVNSSESLQPKGFYGTTQFERIILLAVVIVTLVMHVPPLLNPDITLFGQHWLFVTYPIGMVGVTASWLAVTYMR